MTDLARARRIVVLAGLLIALPVVAVLALALWPFAADGPPPVSSPTRRAMGPAPPLSEDGDPSRQRGDRGARGPRPPPLLRPRPLRRERPVLRDVPSPRSGAHGRTWPQHGQGRQGPVPGARRRDPGPALRAHRTAGSRRSRTCSRSTPRVEAREKAWSSRTSTTRSGSSR